MQKSHKTQKMNALTLTCILYVKTNALVVHGGAMHSVVLYTCMYRIMVWLKTSWLLHTSQILPNSKVRERLRGLLRKSTLYIESQHYLKYRLLITVQNRISLFKIKYFWKTSVCGLVQHILIYAICLYFSVTIELWYINHFIR